MLRRLEFLFCWTVPVRSPAAPLAEHLIGYVDGDGKGAAGLEAAFDAALSGTGEGDTLTCLVNAQGKLRETPEQTHADSGAVGGAVDPFARCPTGGGSRRGPDDDNGEHCGAENGQRRGAGVRQRAGV